MNIINNQADDAIIPVILNQEESDSFIQSSSSISSINEELSLNISEATSSPISSISEQFQMDSQSEESLSQLEGRVKVFPVGSRENPFKLPDAKRSNATFFQEIAPDLLELMSHEVREVIRAIPSIQSKLVWDEEAKGYRLSQEKQRQRPYDEFHRSLTLRYGQDPLFRGGPKQLTARLKSRLELNQEHIFGVVKDDDKIKILVLPRNEVIQLPNGKYYQCRHTHPEFLPEVNGTLVAAGTFIPEPTTLKFNFRTGHFSIHQDDAKKLAKIRLVIHEAFQWASDQTLCNVNPTHEQLKKLALEYQKEHQPTHSVYDETS